MVCHHTNGFAFKQRLYFVEPFGAQYDVLIGFGNHSNARKDLGVEVASGAQQHEHEHEFPNLAGSHSYSVGFSWFIAKRLLKKEKGRRQVSAPIVRIAVGGIALSLSVMVLAVAIVRGFQQEIRAKVIGFASHIQVIKYDSNQSLEAAPVRVERDWMQRIAALPEVASVHPVSRKPGIVKSGDAIEGILFKGVHDASALSFFSGCLEQGRLPRFATEEKSNEILISRSLAKQLHLEVDSSMIVYFVQDPPKARKFVITGIYNTGLGENDFDQIYILGDQRVVQQLNQWDANQSSAVEVVLKDFSTMDRMNEAIYQEVPQDLTTEDAEDRYPQLFGWLALMDTNVVIIITLMLVVSVINMVTSLLILILERVRMIGILKAMGARNGQIARVFLRQAAVLIGSGMLLGNVLGLSLCWIQQQTGWVTLNQETYYLSKVPILLEWKPWLLLNVLCFGVCLVAMLLPSMLVARFRPAKSLRWA
jgi:lipoprotein-releasing system permease protein